MKNNTYTQDKNIKNLSFSEGSELTEQDLMIIASRSKRTYVQDAPLEKYLADEVKYTVAEFNQMDTYDNQTFQIGNNLKGGV